MRVHVTLKNSALGDQETRQSALQELEAEGLREVDEARFKRFGVASGQVDPRKVRSLELLDVVEAVEPDYEATIA